MSSSNLVTCGESLGVAACALIPTASNVANSSTAVKNEPEKILCLISSSFCISLLGNSAPSFRAHVRHARPRRSIFCAQLEKCLAGGAARFNWIVQCEMTLARKRTARAAGLQLCQSTDNDPSVTRGVSSLRADTGGGYF